MLATSQRDKQTQRLNPSVKCSVLKVQVASGARQPFILFLKTLTNLVLYLYKGEGGSLSIYVYPSTVHINFIHFIFVHKWYIYMYKYLCRHIHMWVCGHMYINMYVHY